MGISDLGNDVIILEIVFCKYSSVIPNPMSEKIMTNDLNQFQDMINVE